MFKTSYKLFSYLIIFIFTFHLSISKAQEFNGNGGNIPDASFFGPSPWTNFNINVNSIGTINCDITVCINITHPFTDDLDIRLVSPSGTIIYLSTDNGGAGDNYNGTCFTMGANTEVTEGFAPFNGNYVPEDNLSYLIGENANGLWQLQIRDDDWLFSGSLISWSIDFTCQSDCDVGEEQYTLNLFDSYGDGWDHGTGHLVTINGVDYGGYDFTTGYSYSYTICLDPTDCIDISFTDGGLWEDECSYTLENNSGITIFSGNHLTIGQTIGDCAISGCTDSNACNFEPDAEEDDGSCFYSPLTIDACEVVYCSYEDGEQVASQYIGTNINYLTIEITESGIINDFFYNINWHSHGWGNINFNVNNATIALYDNFGVFVQNIAVIGNNLSISTYQNFSNTLNTDIDVYAGYSIQVFINSPNWGGGTWESYVNEANISFTVITESVNAGNDIQGYTLCYDDAPINLFNFLGNNVNQNGTWSPSLSGGYLGTFDPQYNQSNDYLYTVTGECLTDYATIPITVIDIVAPQITSSEDFICFGSSSLVTYSVPANQGSNYLWLVDGGNIVGSSTTNSIQVDWSDTPVSTISNAVVVTETFNGCSNSSSIDATIIANPLPNLSIDNTEICLGESVNVTVNQAYNNYVWTPTELLNSNFYTPNSIFDNQISVTITSDEGCSTSESIDLTIYETPIVNLSAQVSEICITDSLILTSTPGYNDYSWTPSSISGNTDIYFPSLFSEDMIFLTVTGDGGCTSSDSLEIVVNELPIINLTIDNLEICLGESVTVNTNSGYNNYDWTPSEISSISDTYVPTSLTDNQISVIVTSDFGCSSIETIDFTIYDLPIVNLSIDDTYLCMGESLVVSANSGYNNYAWTPSSISGNTDVYFPTSSSEDMISLTVTGEGGCTSSDSLAIQVFDLPIVNLGVDNSEICIGETISLNTNPGYINYDWSPSSISSNTDIYTPTSLTDNQISVTVTGDGGCTSSDNLDLTIYDLPIVNLSIDDTYLCMGESLVVSANSGYNNYAWTPSSISGNTDVYFPTSSSEDMISLTVTGEGGCTSSDSLAIQVFDLPIVNLGVDNSEICIGETISLNTNPGYINYDWSPSSITSNTDTYTPTSLTDNQISVTITADGGCTSSDSLELTIFDLPIVEVSLSDSVICLGESIAVNSTSGYVNYDWMPAILNSSNQITPELTETNYIVEVTDINGCKSTDDANLVINQLTPIDLTVNGNNTAVICIGEEINLVASSGFETYIWSIPDVISNQISYIPSSFSENEFSVIGTNQFGCNSVSSLNITINSIPTPSLISVFSDSIQTISQSINLCAGDSDIKFSSNVSSASNPTEWVFVDGSGMVIENGQNTSDLLVSFPIVEDYILEFREYGSQNCFTAQQIEIKVNPNPILEVSYTEDCYKDSIYFTNNSIVDTTVQSVNWLVDDYSFDSYNLSYPLSNESNIFELIIIDVLNCSSSMSTSFVPSDRPFVDFYHKPEKITILNPEVSFINLSSNVDSILWDFGDYQISDEWDPIHTYDSLGWFDVILKVQNDEGCKDSIVKKILIENDQICYFPNSFTPDGDGLNDNFGISGFRTEKIIDYDFQITNRWGQVIFYSNDVNEKWDGKTKKGNDAVAGAYLWSAKITDELGKITRKFGDVILIR